MALHNQMCGKLLGDGGIVKQDGRRLPRFKFQHRTEDYECTNYCYLQLKNKIPLNPPVYKKSIDPRLKKGYSESYYVQSKTDETIMDLYKIWYQDGGRLKMTKDMIVFLLILSIYFIQ